MALSPRKSRNLASAMGVVLMLGVLAVQSGVIPVFDGLYQRLELLVYNIRMKAHVPERVKPDRRVVIVDIDERSLREVGQWPWSRHRVAEMIERLHEAGVVVIAFDVLFAEPERNPVDLITQHLEQRSSDSELAASLRELASDVDADAALAGVLQQSEVVLGYAFTDTHDSHSGALPPPLPLAEGTEVDRLALGEMRGYTAPLPQLQKSASSAGFFNLRPDIDGVVRHAPLINRYQGKLYASLALETVRRYLFLQQVSLVTGTISGQAHIEFLQLDKALTIPTDGYGRVLIPFRGGMGSYPYVSAATILAGEADPELMAGSIVLVGTTAAGLYDLRATPLNATYPGVEVHANLITAMLDEKFLVVPAWSKGANLTFGIVVGLLLAFLMPRLSLPVLIGVSLVASLSVIATTSWYWSHYGQVLDLAGPLLLIAVLSVANLTWGFFFESMTRHRLKGMFGQYVPPELVDEMSERPDEFDVEGKARELSVMFADIRGFTSISESLSADELKRFLNRFFTPMTRTIFNHQGTIDKYVGDMVMAFWGAPLRDDAHAVHAIEAALAMQQEAERLKEAFTQAGWPEVNIGVGINSGMMSVGDMGSEYRRTYTVLGDAVNLASRLEGTTKYYGVGIVVGERTRELAGDHFVYRELDLVRVKGKAEAIRVYQPVCLQSEADDELLQEINLLERALAAFRSRQWEESDRFFVQLLECNPGFHLYGLYRERIAELRRQQPDDSWDGVYVRSEK